MLGNLLRSHDFRVLRGETSYQIADFLLKGDYNSDFNISSFLLSNIRE